MIKRCIGCGTKLQQTNSNEPGYTPKTDAKYCMRCFKMNNYILFYRKIHHPTNRNIKSVYYNIY